MKSHFKKILFIICSLAYLSGCTKSDMKKRYASLSPIEQQLATRWFLKKKIIEIPGQQPLTETGFDQLDCFIDLKGYKYMYADANSPLTSDTKEVQDNKNCSWLGGGWKVRSDNKLVLVAPGLDTLIADILFIKPDSLAIKGNYGYIHSDGLWHADLITYCFH